MKSNLILEDTTAKKSFESLLFAYFSVSMRCGPREKSKCLAEMIFGMEARQLTDSLDRAAAIFQMLNGNVDTNGIQKGDGGLSQLPTEKMVNGGFADAARTGKVSHRKICVKMAGDICDRRL